MQQSRTIGIPRAYTWPNLRVSMDPIHLRSSSGSCRGSGRTERCCLGSALRLTLPGSHQGNRAPPRARESRAGTALIPPVTAPCRFLWLRAAHLIVKLPGTIKEQGDGGVEVVRLILMVGIADASNSSHSLKVPG